MMDPIKHNCLLQTQQLPLSYVLLLFWGLSDGVCVWLLSLNLMMVAGAGEGIALFTWVPA